MKERNLRISRLLLFWSFTILLPNTTVGQERTSSQFLFGPFVELGTGVSSTMNQTPIPVYSLSPTCGTFDSTGTRTSLRIGLEGSHGSALNHTLRLHWGVTMEFLSGQFTGTPIDPQRTVDPNSGDLITIDREFQLHYQTQSIQLSFGPEYRLHKYISGYMVPTISYHWGKEFNQSDNVVGSDGQSFDDGQRSHPMEHNVQYASEHFSAGGILGVVGYIPLNNQLFLEPRLALSMDFDLLATTHSIQSIAFRGGVGLKFDLSPQHIPAPPFPPSGPEAPPTPPPTTAPLPQASIKIFGVDEAGVQSDVTHIKAWETLYEQRLPILPLIYFSQDSTTLPPRYNSADDLNATHAGELSLVEVNHQLVEILAQRLHEHPDATLELAGITSGDEHGDVGSQRREALQRSLQEHGIAPERIMLGSSRLKRSDERRAEGREENRRVEITSSHESLTAPLVRREIVRDFSPPTIRVIPDYESTVGLLGWEITVWHNNQPMTSYSSKDQEAGIAPNFDWQITQPTNDTAIAPIVAEFTVTDSLGRSTTAFDTIKVELEQRSTLINQDVQESVGGERSQTWIIGFEYDSEKLTALQESQIAQVAERIRDGAQIQITGYTDRTGTEEHNVALSQRRAESIASRLRINLQARGITGVLLTTVGGGVDRNIFDNNLPEGRTLSRSVVITVEQSKEIRHDAE